MKQLLSFHCKIECDEKQWVSFIEYYLKHSLKAKNAFMDKIRNLELSNHINN